MLTFSIDYLSFTIFNVEIQTIIDHLPKCDFQFMEKGRLGYKKAIMYKGVRILYDGNEEMGIHVDASSSALAWATDILYIPTIQGNVKFTRIDIACDILDDDFYNIISIHTLNHNFKTKRRKRSEIKSYNTSSNQIVGRTIYFGSRTSSVFMRIYDKALEKKEDKDWTRMELEIKSKTAHNLAKMINEYPLDKLFFLILNNYIDFIDRSASKNISRCPRLDFWNNFITTDKSVTIAPKKEDKNISKTYNWLLKQVSKSLAKIDKVDTQGNLNLVDGLIQIGNHKISAEDEMQIEEFLKDI